MAIIWKDTLYTGTVHVPTGDRRKPVRKVTFTPADIQNAAIIGNAKINEGWNVPVCWDHQSVEPTRLSHADKIAANARNTLGSVVGYRVQDGRLEAGLEVPDDADVKQLAKVKFVSPEVNFDWIDSTGKLWPGVTISHVAATPRPIQHRQQPFQLSHEATNTRSNSLRLSFGDYRMADEKKKPDDEATVKSTEGSDDSEYVEEPSDLEAPGEPVVPPSPEPMAGVEFKAALAALASHGLTLPADTNASNLCERILVASTALNAVKAATPPTGMADEDGTQKPVTIDGQAPTESKQTPPISLSFSKAEQRAVALERRTILRRVDNLVSSGRITPAIGTKLKSEANKVQLSFADDGELNTNNVLVKIEAYEALEKHAAWSPKGAKGDASVQLSHASVATPAGDLGKMVNDTPDGRTDDEFFKQWNS